MNRTSRFFGVLVAGVLSACGGGGGSDGGNNPPPVPAPGLSYSPPASYTVGTAIAPLNPTVTGNITSFGVAPALPTGLSLSTTTGAITGTPSAITPTATYVVTATNAGGSTPYNLTLTVNDQAPTLRFPTSNYTFSVGAASRGVAPESGGGAVVTWSAAPVLPAGLLLNSQGAIVGTPTAATATANYRITAQNTGGSAIADLSLTVAAGPLVDLGGSGVEHIVHRGDRMLTYGSRTVLWNASTGARVASEVSQCDSFCVDPPIALEGSTAVVQNTAGLRVYDSVTGALLTTIDMNTGITIRPWKLSTDGSYIANAIGGSLTVRSRAGEVLFTRNAAVVDRMFAEPGVLRVISAGSSSIENIAIPAGTSTMSPPFTGFFQGWFADGQRFLSRANNAWFIYSNEGVQQAVVDLPTFSGAVSASGDWYWGRVGGALNFYRVGSGNTPVATRPVDFSMRVVSSGSTLAILDDDASNVTICDLTGMSPVCVDHVSPIGPLRTFGATSATDWAVATSRGALIGEIPGAGTPLRYAFGGASSLAASPQHIAIATPSGILVYDAATRLSLGVIPLDALSLSMSADGATLLAVGRPAGSADSNDRLLRVYSLPSRNQIAERVYL